MHRKTVYFVIAILSIFASASRAQTGWEEVGKMPHPVYGGKAFVVDSLILILGGTQTPPDQFNRIQASNLVQAYDPQRNTWRVTDTLSIARYGFAADTLGPNGLLLCGGTWQNDLNFYTLEKWQSRNTGLSISEILLRSNAWNRIYATGHLYKNRFYLFGGMPSPTSNISDRYSDLVIFDLKESAIVFNSDSLAAKRILPYHHASVRMGNTVYIIGGVYSGITTSILACNLDKDYYDDLTFPEIGELTTPRAGCSAVIVPGNIVVSGGYSELSGALAGTDLISLSDFQTVAGPAMNHPRREPMTVVYDGWIYAFGGWNDTDSVVTSIERIITDIAPATAIGQEIAAGLPADFELGQNYPNPFNGSTIIPVRLSEAGLIRLDIFNVLGKMICTVADDLFSAGRHRIFWEGLDDKHEQVPSGLYFYRCKFGTTIQTGKMILIR